jgi:hypothetical protein
MDAVALQKRDTDVMIKVGDAVILVAPPNMDDSPLVKGEIVGPSWYPNYSKLLGSSGIVLGIQAGDKTGFAVLYRVQLDRPSRLEFWADRAMIAPEQERLKVDNKANRHDVLHYGIAAALLLAIIIMGWALTRDIHQELTEHTLSFGFGEAQPK